MSEITFSIIVPCFNAERYIANCVTNLLRQTYQKFEVIFVDDCSEDKTLELCEHFAKQYNCFRVVTYQSCYEKNRGQEAARNLGLSYATGEWVIFLDVDDWLADDALQTISEWRDKGDIVLFDFNYVYANKILSMSAGFIDGIYDAKQIAKEINKDLAWDTLACIGNKAYRRSFLSNNNIIFNSNYKFFEDIIFFVDALIGNPQIRYIKRTLYNYLQISDSSNHVYRRNLYNYSERALRRLQNLFDAFGLSCEMEYYIHLRRMYNAYYAIKNELSQKGIYNATRYTKHLLEDVKLKHSLVFNRSMPLTYGEKIINNMMLCNMSIAVELMVYMRMKTNDLVRFVRIDGKE